ncbi:hypothetical protein SLEP1_g57522 [Rubroshorea leprosula]|uniref:Uncharacterized protein n=1 Tax=Rubroshorea leprosula TaxID=152421 RepID=A0AAV5MMR3_9ROSI|nr:hypothetical protein SLEP1_g57522 [Rubroshorea leprosula]
MVGGCSVLGFAEFNSARPIGAGCTDPAGLAGFNGLKRAI